MKDEKVFLTGGSGRIGRRVARKLLERGYAVRLLSHRSSTPSLEGPGLEVVPGDILDQDCVKQLVPGCAFVVHLAAAWDMFPRPFTRRRTTSSSRAWCGARTTCWKRHGGRRA